MQHISCVLQDEYEYLIEQKAVLEKAFKEQSTRKRESAEQWAETRHDNFDFEDAERQQQLINGRIALVNQQLQTAKIISQLFENTEKKIYIWSRVTAEVDNKKQQWHIGGNPTIPGRVSYISPLGKAIMGAKEWETLRFKRKNNPYFIRNIVLTWNLFTSHLTLFLTKE
jgi:transcription elongation GreA/GreB family factor